MTVNALLGLPAPRPLQYPRPQTGTVHSTTGGLYVAVDGLVHGPCKWGRAATHTHSNPEGGSTGATILAVPPVGTECLVVFAGQGIEDPWVIAFSAWPA